MRSLRRLKNCAIFVVFSISSLIASMEKRFFHLVLRSVVSLVYLIKINEINFMEKKKENGLNKTKIALTCIKQVNPMNLNWKFC